MKVLIPTQLRSYTAGEPVVDLPPASTLGSLFATLETAFPGIRFRMVDEQDRLRPHIKVFINQDAVRSLDSPLHPDDEVMIVGALSGG